MLHQTVHRTKVAPETLRQKIGIPLRAVTRIGMTQVAPLKRVRWVKRHFLPPLLIATIEMISGPRTKECLSTREADYPWGSNFWASAAWKLSMMSCKRACRETIWIQTPLVLSRLPSKKLLKQNRTKSLRPLKSMRLIMSCSRRKILWSGKKTICITIANWKTSTSDTTRSTMCLSLLWQRMQVSSKKTQF